MTNEPLDRYLVQRYSQWQRRDLLRPMTSNEIIDTSIRIYQSLGWTMLKLTAIPTLFTFGGLVFLMEIVIPMFSVTKTPDNITNQVGEALFVTFVGLTLAIPIMMIGISSASGVIVQLVADRMMGSVPDPSAALAAAKKTFRKLFLLNVFETIVGWSGVILSGIFLMFSAMMDTTSMEGEVASGVVAGVGMMGFMFGFLILAFVVARHALTPAIVVLEGLPAMQAAKRSVKLMAANGKQMSGYWSVFSLFGIIPFLLLLISPAIAMGLSFVDLEGQIGAITSIPYAGSIVTKLIAFSPTFLAVWVLVPIWCTAITVLYFERRIRHEGLDIEVLARDVWKKSTKTRFEL